MATELDDADLLDIDGSDDQTMAFESRSEKRRRPAAMKHARRSASPGPQRAPQEVTHVSEREDLRLTNPVERRADVDADPPTVIIAPSARPTRKAPAHFARPVVTARRDAHESYPPVAVMSAGHAQLTLKTGSRWGWVAAAVLGTALLIGGSLRAAPQVAALDSANASAPPAAVDAVKPANTVADDAKVVKFEEAQGVIIKTGPKPQRHVAPPPPPAAKKPAPPPAHAKTPEKAAAEKSAEEKELEELQLRAASR